MDQLGHLMEGFSVAFTPQNLLFLVIGAVLGTAVGVLPGLGSAMAVALLLPVTFSLDPTGAFIMFASIYFGGLFGDSTSGILLNTPGNSSAIATTFEGHRMAKDGRAAKALGTSAIGAFIGGTIACILVVFFAPAIVQLATIFGPAEYFALAVFAFVAISAVVADSIVRGLVSLGLGFALALVGIDGMTGTERFTAGSPVLFDGISIIVITVGLLALGEVLHVGSYIRRSGGPGAVVAPKGSPMLNAREWRQALPAFLRGTAFGVPFGAIPVGGSEVPTFLAYGTEKRLAKRRNDPDFGTRGAIQGVAGPEAAGNATAGSAMGALLGLGIPTSATAAMMIAAFQQYGMQPGPFIQLGTYNCDWQKEQEMQAWYSQVRMPAITETPGGAIRVRKLVSTAGWAKHGILYEFLSLQAKKDYFALHKDRPDMKPWTDWVAQSLIHAPGSATIANRIWPPVAG